jgi:hypothetical protein
MESVYDGKGQSEVKTKPKPGNGKSENPENSEKAAKESEKVKDSRKPRQDGSNVDKKKNDDDKPRKEDNLKGEVEKSKNLQDRSDSDKKNNGAGEKPPPCKDDDNYQQGDSHKGRYKGRKNNEKTPVDGGGGAVDHGQEQEGRYRGSYDYGRNRRGRGGRGGSRYKKAWEPRYSGKRQVSAEVLMMMSKTARQDEVVTFDLSSGRPKIELNDWFKQYPPSSTRRSQGIGWIVALSESFTEADKSIIYGNEESEEKLRAEWTVMTEDEDMVISYTSIKDLAKKHGLSGGKWMFHLPANFRLDEIWQRVVLALAYNKLPPGAIAAKISPVNDLDAVGEFQAHVVCVFTREFGNEDEVIATEKALRAIPIYGQLLYKPNIYSSLGIYRNNVYKLRPTIYSSDWQSVTRRSIIESVLDLGWTYSKGQVDVANQNKDMEKKLMDLRRALCKVDEALARIEADHCGKNDDYADDEDEDVISSIEDTQAASNDAKPPFEDTQAASNDAQATKAIKEDSITTTIVTM